MTSEADLNGPLGVEDDDDSRSLSWGTVGAAAIFTLDSIPHRPVWEEDSDDSRGVDAAEEEQAARMERKTKRQELENELAQWRSVRTERTLNEGEKVVKIASGEDFLLALKANGEVWFSRVRDNEALSNWEYVSNG
jgi:SCF-associated factor 1